MTTATTAPSMVRGRDDADASWFLLDTGEPAVVRELPAPGAPDLVTLDRLCARSGIELVG